MSAPALVSSAATKRYGTDHALAGLSLTVERGQVHAIVGLNGAGKTTLMRAIARMVRLDSGAIAVLGEQEPDARTWRRFGHMVEQPFAYAELTVRENLIASARLHAVPTAHAHQIAAEWLERLALERWANRGAGTLSAGNRQRLGLAAALAHGPDMVVLDEPTNALDPAGVILLRDALLERSAAGAGVLVSSHHLDEVSRIAHSISVIHAGRVIGTLEPHGNDLERTFFQMVHAYDLSHGSAA